MMRKKSCGAVVFRKNREIKYLLLHYEAGHWDYVKGEVEKGESERDTVVRELREETGITDARFIEGFREEISYFFKIGGRTVYKEVVFFLMETGTSDVVLSFEHTDCEWLDYQKAMGRLTFETATNILRKAHTFLKEQKVIENGHR